MTLYSAWFCPFAQRAWMALLNQSIDFNYIEIDPYEKTEEWLAISKNTGQVPVLKYLDTPKQENTLVDSTAIVDFLDQRNPKAPSLFSNNPEERRKQEQWIAHINKKIIPYIYRYLKAVTPGKERDDAKNELVKGVTEFAQEMTSNAGPYFNGGQLSAVDISFAPFAYRIDLLLKHYRGFSLPEIGDVWERYDQWYKTAIKHPAFEETSVTLKDYNKHLIDFYLPYSKGDGQKDVSEL